MCPVCLITIGGGLLLAKTLGINNVLIIGLLTVLLSLLTDRFLRKINRKKVFFPYQKVIVSVVLLFIAIVIAKFLL